MMWGKNRDSNSFQAPTRESVACQTPDCSQGHVPWPRRQQCESSTAGNTGLGKRAKGKSAVKANTMAGDQLQSPWGNKN